jgi:low temperature requirement protein LtrA
VNALARGVSSRTDSDATAQVAVERHTSPVELLWDLVFVFAVTQVTTLLSGDLTWTGFGRSMLVLALVWWAWSAFVWAANAQAEDAAALRPVLLVAMVLIFVCGVAIPHAFGDEATLFAAAYASVRLLHLGLYADASRHGSASRSAIAGFALTVAVGMALLLAGSFLEGWHRDALWTAAVAIDYAGPGWLTRARLRGLQAVEVSHFAERYGLFVLICLGESIVAIGARASALSLTAAIVVAVVLGIVVTIGLWWAYFERFAAAARERLREHDDPVLAASDAYSYLHLPLVAGIINLRRRRQAGDRRCRQSATRPRPSGTVRRRRAVPDRADRVPDAPARDAERGEDRGQRRAASALLSWRQPARVVGDRRREPVARRLVRARNPSRQSPRAPALLSTIKAPVN